MAGDWIKMRVDLRTDPGVIVICEMTDLDEDSVVGKLHRIWSWADTQVSRSGHAVGVTQKWIDRYLGVEGFAIALVKAGWLRADDDGISFPNFDRHMSQTAKERALAARRKVTQRSRSCHGASVTKTGPEKRREDINPPKSPLGDFSVDDLENQWIESVRTKLSEARIAAAIHEADMWTATQREAAFRRALAGGRTRLTRPKPDPAAKPQLDETTARELKRAKIVKAGRAKGIPEDQIEAAVRKELES